MPNLNPELCLVPDLAWLDRVGAVLACPSGQFDVRHVSRDLANHQLVDSKFVEPWPDNPKNLRLKTGPYSAIGTYLTALYAGTSVDALLAGATTDEGFYLRVVAAACDMRARGLISSPSAQSVLQAARNKIFASPAQLKMFSPPVPPPLYVDPPPIQLKPPAQYGGRTTIAQRVIAALSPPLDFSHDRELPKFTDGEAPGLTAGRHYAQTTLDPDVVLAAVEEKVTRMDGTASHAIYADGFAAAQTVYNWVCDMRRGDAGPGRRDSRSMRLAALWAYTDRMDVINHIVPYLQDELTAAGYRASSTGWKSPKSKCAAGEASPVSEKQPAEPTPSAAPPVVHPGVGQAATADLSKVKTRLDWVSAQLTKFDGSGCDETISALRRDLSETERRYTLLTTLLTELGGAQ